MLLTLSGKVAKYELKLTLSIEKKRKKKKVALLWCGSNLEHTY